MLDGDGVDAAPDVAAGRVTDPLAGLIVQLSGYVRIRLGQDPFFSSVSLPRVGESDGVDGIGRARYSLDTRDSRHECTIITLPQTAFDHTNARLLKVEVASIPVVVQLAALEVHSLFGKSPGPQDERGSVFQLRPERLLDLLVDLCSLPLGIEGLFPVLL